MLRRLHHEQPASFAFTPANEAWAEAQISKYPEGRQASAIIPLLWRAQEQEGWLSRPAIEAVADKITDAQYKAIYDAAMVIYQRSTPSEAVRAVALDAELLNQVAARAAEAAVAASDRRERDEGVDVRARAFDRLFTDNQRQQRARVREYERDAVNAMQAARSPDPVEAEWGAMWMDQVDEGYGGPHINRSDEPDFSVRPRMFPRAVRQVVRPPNARDVMAYYRLSALVRPAQGEAPPPPQPGDALANYAHYIRNNEPPPRLIEYPGDGSHTHPPRYTGEDSEMELVD